MQIIFQDPYSSLNPRMTVGDAIMEPMSVHGIYNNPKERKDKVYELLDKVNLNPEQFNRYPHEFSGGQTSAYMHSSSLGTKPEFYHM
jgi:peptide/nickel transport system ATP-binding protein